MIDPGPMPICSPILFDGPLLPASVLRPSPLSALRPTTTCRGPVFMITGLGVGQGKNLSFHAMRVPLKILSDSLGPFGSTENPLPRTSVQRLAQVQHSSPVIYNHLASFI